MAFDYTSTAVAQRHRDHLGTHLGRLEKAAQAAQD